MDLNSGSGDLHLSLLSKVYAWVPVFNYHDLHKILNSVKAKPLLIKGSALSYDQRLSKSKTTITFGILPYHMIKGSAKAKPLLLKEFCLVK